MIGHFEFRKLKTPFWGKKLKRTEMRRGSTFNVRLLFVTHKQKRYEVYGAFSVFEHIKNLPFYDKEPKPRFFEFRGFGHNSTSNNSVDQCCIFWNRLFNVHLSTYQTDRPIKHFFCTKTGFLIFESQKNGWPHIITCPKDSKKVNIFEIGSLVVYDRGGGCPGSTLYCVLTCTYNRTYSVDPGQPHRIILESRFQIYLPFWNP